MQTTRGIGQSRVGGVVQAVADTAVRSVIFRTQITPDVQVRPFAPGKQARRDPVTEFFLEKVMRPSIIVETPVGLLEHSPWGRPTGNFFPVLAAGTVIGGALLVWVVWRGLTR